MKTPSSSRPFASPLPSFRAVRVVPALGFAALLWVSSGNVFAQAPAAGADDANRRRRPTPDGAGGGERGNFNPAEMQARMLTQLRERLEVTDDEEWKVISDRIAKVNEIRRNAPGAGGGIGAFMGRGGPGGPGGGPGGGGGDTSGRGRGTRTGGSTEMTALASALRDKLPDAEVKSRLDRVRELRKENDLKLTKAQEELRVVLSVRQEAIAVMFGLLP